MKKEYAIFSDVDGTIYSHSKEYHPEVKESIRQAQEKGVEFIMCTGNPYFEKMKDMAKELNVDYFVGSNGAFIYDVKNSKEIKINTMSKEEAQKILDIMNEEKIGSDWWDEEDLYANEYANPRILKFLEKVASKGRGLKIQNHITKGIHKIEAYTDDSPESVEKIDKLLERLEGSGMQVARMKPHHLEITKNDVSKGHAVVELSKILGIDLDNVMTIGDSANDHSMFKVTQYSYAMGNADPFTQEVANYHTSAVDQNGLGEAILDFLYRKRLTDNFKDQK